MKHGKKTKINCIQLIFIIILIASICGIICYLCIANKEKQEYKNLQENMATENHTDEKSDRIEKVKELQKENSDIVAWIEIEGTNINYPVLHTTNNDFYLNYNYKKEETLAGSLFLDKDFDIKNGSSNYLIYGHRNKQGLMFEDLLKYAKEDFYKEHKKIRFTTDKEDRDYEIMAVFYSRVYYKDEQNVFRYYYFVNAKDENEYNNYVKKSKDASIYDTGVTAKYGEQLLTLSTCEYSQEDGRFVIVAK